MTREEEIQLVKQWRQGDRQAPDIVLRHILESTRSIIRSILLCSFHSDNYLDDILQEMSIVVNNKVLSGEYVLEGSGRIRTYALKIAHNKILKIKPSETSPLDPEHLSPQPHPIDIAIQRELMSKWLECINKLDDEDHFIYCSHMGLEVHAFGLGYVKKMTIVQIAQKLGKSRTTISEKFNKIVAKIIKILSDYK